MPIVFACIAPHGGHLLLPEGAQTPVPNCRAAMETLAGELRDAHPETILVLTPHGVTVKDAYSLGVCPRAFGEIDGVSIEMTTDLELAQALANAAEKRQIPLAPLVGQDPNAPFPLDWGVTIPLALLLPGLETKPELLVACPSRNLTRENLVDWGEAIVDAAETTNRRVALVVSADQGHGHAADGPYGFTSRSANYDAAMQSILEDDDLPGLLAWPEDYAERALADSYWQTLSLLGVAKHLPLKPRFLGYDVDHYFGLLVAGFTLD